MKVVTYNLRCVWDTVDGINNFIHRAGMVYEKILAEKPDLIGFQEMRAPHLQFLERVLPEYLFIGQGRDADLGGEGVYTAIKKDVFQLMTSDLFWLSPQKYQPGSRFEDQSDCPRTCVSTLLRHRESGCMIRLYNTHLDHISESARRKGMDCVLEQMKKDNEGFRAEQILLGDFNAIPSEEAIVLCSQFLTDVTADIEYSFHAFGKKEKHAKIDYIFVSEKLLPCVKSVEAWKDEKSGIYLSDHFPISLTLDLCAKNECQ